MIVKQDNKRYYVSDGKCWELPDMRNKAFFKGKVFEYRDDIAAFLRDGIDSCIVPVYCTHVSEKRAFKSVTLDTSSEEFRFNNSERGQYSYYRNEIKNIEKGNVYFIYLEKFHRAKNDCLIKAAMKLEMRDRGSDTECSCFVGSNIESMIEAMDDIIYKEQLSEMHSD